MSKKWLLGSLVALSLGGPVLAQDRSVVVREGGGAQVHKLSVLMKSKILIQEDQPAGQVVDIVLSEGGCVDYVVATYEDQYYVVPYSAVNVRYADQIVFVDIAPAQFKQVQFFSNGQWPDFYAADYRQQVFNTFNVTNVRVDNDRSPTPRDGRPRDRNDREAGDRPRTNPDRAGTDRPKAGPDRPKDGDSATPRTPKTEGTPRGTRDPGDAPRTPREGADSKGRTEKEATPPSTAPKGGNPAPRPNAAERDPKGPASDEKAPRSEPKSDLNDPAPPTSDAPKPEPKS